MTWIEELKAGDRVIVRRGNFVAPEVRLVDRVTPKQVVVGEARYWKRNGELVGTGRWSHRIDEWTEAVQDEIDEKRLYEKMRYSVKWGEIRLSKLRRIDEILEEECSS